MACRNIRQIIESDPYFLTIVQPSINLIHCNILRVITIFTYVGLISYADTVVVLFGMLSGYSYMNHSFHIL